MKLNCEKIKLKCEPPGPSPVFFRLGSNPFSDIGSVGRIEKKKKKKNVTRRLAIGGWYPSIIALELGKNETRTQNQYSGKVG